MVPALPDDLTAAEQAQLTFLRQVHPSLEIAYGLVQEFVSMVRKREGERLGSWLAPVGGSHIPELVRFGRGIERDQAAVPAFIDESGIALVVVRLKLSRNKGRQKKNACEQFARRSGGDPDPGTAASAQAERRRH